MPVLWLVIAVLLLAAAGYVAGRQRALASAGNDPRDLHSLPSYYGSHVFIMTAVPALIAMIVWLLVQPLVIENRISNVIPDTAISADTTRSLVMADVRRVAEGLNLAVRQGIMSAEEAAAMRSDGTNVRERLGEVGIALGSDVEPYVLQAGKYIYK